MIINHPSNERTVIDYDFTFSSGLFLSVTIDASLGDSIDIGERDILIHLSSKPTLDPDKPLPAEDMILSRERMDLMQKRSRTVVDRSPNEEVEWKRLLEEIQVKGGVN